ncbi:ACT domain-containing protein [Thalassotalea marina]|uniref:DUF2241 domain-containing protein n=1 Tax=Thalassotalea marina TaxID=1673741 RepID=A0A919BJV3_9GAMM|nr:ACT domain-containing protein [Thalassotalea marina]GHF96027.1 hypothetical protein GCM10017161_25440 [Thalassotalea marina]
MTGLTDLTTLLSTMTPTLQQKQYVFVTFADGKYGDGIELEPIAMFQEQEGLTLVIPEDKAKEYQFDHKSTFS